MIWFYAMRVGWLVIPALAIICGACTKSGLSITPTLQPALSPTYSASPTVTRTPKETQTVQVEDYPWHIYEVSISRDRQWTARTMYQTDYLEGREKTCIEVTSSDNERSWSATYEWELDPQLSVRTRIIDWSENGDRIFYSNAVQVGGCQTFTNGGDLSVLDLETGFFHQILPMQAYGVGTWFSVSPEGTMVAFPPDVEGSSITIVNFEDGDEKIIQLDLDAAQSGYRIGHIVWSPDSEKIAFTINLNPCDPTVKGPFGSAVGIADTRTLAYTIPFFDENRYLLTESWSNESTIILNEIQGQILLMDANTGKFSDR